jgi:hypothetical protein
MEEVRIAGPHDLQALMALALAACDENGFVNPNPDKLANEIWPALHLNHGAVGIIGAPNEQAKGAVLLRIGSMWYSDQMVVEEKAIFIHPDFRDAKGGRAKKLCQFSKSVADSLNIPLMIGVLSNNRTKAKVRMYEREFGKASGAYFLYGAKTGILPQPTEQ